jgi:hypothetical protein
MDKTRRILSPILIILGVPVAIIVAVPLALVLAVIFYAMALAALVRTVFELLLKGLAPGRSKPAANPAPEAEPISPSSKVQPSDGF